MPGTSGIRTRIELFICSEFRTHGVHFFEYMGIFRFILTSERSFTNMTSRETETDKRQNRGTGQVLPRQQAAPLLFGDGHPL